MGAKKKDKKAKTVMVGVKEVTEPKAVWSVYLIEDFGDGQLCTSHREDFPTEADAWEFAHSEADVLADGEGFPQFVCDGESITFASPENTIRTLIVVRRVKMEIAKPGPPLVANCHLG